MVRAYITHRGRPGVSFGCLGTLVIGFVYLIMAALVLFAAMVVLGGFAVTLVVALIALAIDRLLVAVSPRYRARRSVRGGFEPVGRVTETTSRLMMITKPKRR